MIRAQHAVERERLDVGGVGGTRNTGGGEPAVQLEGALRQAALPAALGSGAGERGQNVGKMLEKDTPCLREAVPDQPSASKKNLGLDGTSPLALSVAQVAAHQGLRQTALGSGFFYECSDKIHYITSRHLIIEENKGHRPNIIMLNLHMDFNMTTQKIVSIDLYDSNQHPVWREHPDYGKAVDIVAIPISEDELNGCKIIPLSKEWQVPDGMTLDLGQDLMVVGFPGGLSDAVHNLPLARNASLASYYRFHFNGMPCMLVDSRLHPGTSGSPVFTKPVFNARRPDGSSTTYSRGKTYLIGIHSEGAHMHSRGEAGEDGPLDLNRCWLASLLDDMT